MWVSASHKTHYEGKARLSHPLSQVTLGYAVPYVDPTFGCGVYSTLTDAVQQE